MKPSKSTSQQQVSIRQEQFYSGPVPPPEVLKKYEEIHPGFADRLLTMAEKEQSERIATQNKIIDTEKELQLKELSNFKRGQIFAIMSVMAVVGLCTYSFYLGYANEARDIAVAVIVGLAGVFIAGRFYIRKKSNKEN